ncbi:hypothetical protein [uncultured Psychrobacter sp.]|uniref:hypothetical protein n=1 Tax=uncultured Psychrobacter sp. TaxID=259303 RepID=UPI002609614E|nr:hypothetical protein [uncultured Psychrobacter sp.]
MTKRLMNIMVIATASMWVLTGCNNSADTTGSADTATEPTVSDSSTPTNEIDWSLVASGQEPADLADYNYPFAHDSQNVRDYAEYFDVDNATAQHNLTVSMASNEALSKVLDQVNDSYISHELTDDKDMTLIIHTTPDITASSYNYVLAGDFAEGLVLPIEIKPDGKKGEGEVHGEVEE